MIIPRFLLFFQSQEEKNKVRFGGSLQWGVEGGSVGASSFGWFLRGFGCFLLVEDDFGWFLGSLLF